MNQSIRVLTLDDFPFLEAMETGIEDDYVKRIFERLVSTEENRLYGLFVDGQLASVCGYTIFAERYAMLGRIRSDVRFRGNDLASKLTVFVRDEAFKRPSIHWVGANTQEENGPARRVLEKTGFREFSTLYGATAKDVSMFENGGNTWNKISSLERKKEWISQLYSGPDAVFPYECYYPFPASPELFADEKLMDWSFYENESGTRVLITKKDFKKYTYLQAIYPFDDLMEQSGFWETVSVDYLKLAAETEGETYVWMDLTQEQVLSLPSGHPFKLPSPWVLYGSERP
ncbi:GNAT family N-acetyltransferase [Planococcus sp. YIM B11945]|uniref:GNAT family N-acetyltransferase n=1 Tax=Planococcus sp. YIM B11945 TaxID=3435410 RepID=UPI003D7D08DC